MISYQWRSGHLEYTVKTNPLTPILGMKVKQGKSVIWLFSKIHLRITISMGSFQRDLFIDMVVDRFILKNNRSPSVSPSHPKQV